MTGEGVRCNRRRRQRCALMKVTQRVPAVRGELTDDLGANTDSCDRIALQRASMRRNIMLKGLGIRGMSVKIRQ
jgi:hypothetical protein